jgi:hypothetical protein
VSAVPEEFMRELSLQPPRRPPEPESACDPGQRSEQTFWQWFAIGVLVFCWVAEATMCALRGF